MNIEFQNMSSASFHRGINIAFQRERERMVNRLKMQGICEPSILSVMGKTPRHIFIDEALSSHAYADHSLPIGYGQTISQPYIVARMTEALLAQNRLDNVLEIGSGCGYQTAILAQLVGKVYSVERIEGLSIKARERLAALELYNVDFHHADGSWGWKENAPYQGIIVTAAPEQVPADLLKQLAVGGRLIMPIGAQGRSQKLVKIIRTRNGYEQYDIEEVSFVPLRKGVS